MEYLNKEPSAPELSRQPNDNKLESLKQQVEKKAELSPRNVENSVENAKNEALEKAKSIESNREKDNEKQLRSNGRRSGIGKKQLSKSYKQTIKQVQSELPTGSRIFSKFIHNSLVEKTSDIVGSTVARQNSMLAGSICAFMLTLLVYIVAKNIGYNLSGSETIAAFIIGWLIGLIYDYFRVLFTGKKY